MIVIKILMIGNRDDKDNDDKENCLVLFTFANI